MTIEYEQMDVLQNIEHVVVRLYKHHREMSDYDVLRVYEDVLDDFVNEQKNRPLRRHKHSELEQALYNDIKAICEWRLGHCLLAFEEGDVEISEPIDIETMIRCIKRLIKSINRWNKMKGRQGYLNFIIQHVS